MFTATQFATNRWAVGPQPTTAYEVRQHNLGQLHDERERARKDRRVRRLKQIDVKKELRPVLMAIDPHCCRCGTPLQDRRHDWRNYACVILKTQQLVCKDCSAEDHHKHDRIGEPLPAAA